MVLDKLALNNACTALRPKVTQAKVRLINSLTRKIKQLKLRKEKSPDPKNILKKINRAVLLINNLKSLNVFYLSKKAFLESNIKLVSVKQAAEPLTPEHWVAHNIIYHPLIVQTVKELHAKLNLEADENSDWREVIETFGCQNKDILRKTKKQKLKQKKYEKKLELNSTLKTKAEDKKLNKIALPTPKKDKKEKPKRVRAKVFEDETALKNEVSYENKIAITNKSLEEVNDKNELQDSLQIDSFFITGNGSNYNAVITKQKHNKEENMDSDINPPPKFQSSVYKNSDRFSKPYNNNSRFEHNYNPENSNFRHNSNNNSQNNTSSSETLHPSWQAKLKQKASVEFQGTKIRFDDEGLHSQRSEYKNKIQYNNYRKEENQQATSEKLHPSWEAKKNQKVKVEFQGSKIKFDD